MGRRVECSVRSAEMAPVLGCRSWFGATRVGSMLIACSAIGPLAPLLVEGVV